MPTLSRHITKKAQSRIGSQITSALLYSTMHPWEDFAETFAVYLDMASTLDTAFHNQLVPQVNLTDLNWMISGYQKLGVALNEMNRNNGLLDYLPEVIAGPIERKLRFTCIP